MGSQSTSPSVILPHGSSQALQRSPRPGGRLVAVRRAIRVRTETELRDRRLRRLAGNQPRGNRRLVHPPRLQSSGAAGAGSATTGFSDVRR